MSFYTCFDWFKKLRLFVNEWNLNWNNFHEYLQQSLKSGGTKDHFRWVKVPGTSPY
jgi:hypothetical protein